MMQTSVANLRTSIFVVTCLIVVGVGSTAETPLSAGSAAPESPVAGRCPEPRDTARAPDSFYSRTNPLPKTTENLKRGRLLYESDAKPLVCAACHGIDGDGNGPTGRELVPPPRNFRCAESMARVTDGQMYWVIENGSGAFHLLRDRARRRSSARAAAPDSPPCARTRNT